MACETNEKTSKCKQAFSAFLFSAPNLMMPPYENPEYDVGLHLDCIDVVSQWVLNSPWKALVSNDGVSVMFLPSSFIFFFA